MIAHIQGRLVEKTPTEVVIDCNGVGYHINISLHTFSLIPDSESLKLYTFLQIKEDSHSLFGFVEKQERELFKLFLSVSFAYCRCTNSLKLFFVPFKSSPTFRY